jgi:O-antigen ligase
VPLALFLFLQARTRWLRFIVVGIALGLTQSIIGSKARSVWLALPVAMLGPTLRYPRLRPLVAGIIALLGVEVLLAPQLGLDFLGLQARLRQISQVYDRVALTATASNMIEHRPLFGFGFGMYTFQVAKAAYYTSWAGVPAKWAVFPNSPHNDLLNVLVMMGMSGLLAYVALLTASWQVLWGRHAPRASRTPIAAALAAAVQAIFVVVLINGLFHSVMHMAYVQTLFFFLLGIVAGGQASAAAAAPAAKRAGWRW